MYSYLPEWIMKNMVIQIIMNKTCDLSNKSNYKPISLATVFSKVLDCLLNTVLGNLHDNQTDFKAGLFTDTAILCL